MVFELHEYRPIYRFEASAVKAMRLILTREFSFQLILLSLLHCDVDHGVEVDILEDESLEQYLLHVCRPRIIVLILSSRSILFFSAIGHFVLGCIDMGLLMPPLLPLLLFEEARFYPHREGNGFPMHA